MTFRRLRTLRIPVFCLSMLLGLLFIAGCSSSGTLQRPSKSLTESEAAALAKGIHERVLTMDTHDDISPDFASDKDDESSPDNRRQVTLYKMKKGGLDAEFFAAFTGNGERTPQAFESAYKRVLGLIDAIHRLPQRYPELVDIAYAPDDVTRIRASGKLVACIGMENGYPIGNDLARMKEFYDRGTRYITLTHSGHNQICDSSTPREGEPKEEHGGLSDFGKQVIREMNRLGMLIDVSHASKKATIDVLTLSEAPIIASHSGASAVNEHARNIDDETLRLFRKNGGVVHVVSLADYVKARADSPERLAAQEAIRKEFGIPQGRGEAARKAMQALTAEQRTAFRDRLRELEVKHPRTPVTVSDMIDHVDHIVKTIGIDHVGIGTDFDGGGGVTGFNDASESMNVTIELVKRGYSEEDIAKIWGGNLLRVWREVEKVAGK
jgi:microsomal dipeptidase-like Zn-dependent dipeptidase